MGALIPERLLLSFSLLLFFSLSFSFSFSISLSFLVRTIAAFRGTSLRSLFQENRGLLGHFASLVVSRTSAAQRRFAAYRGTSLRSCFQKKCLLPMGILIFFFKKVPATYADFDFFFSKIPPILKLEAGFLSDKKSFSQIFQNTPNFFHLKFISIKKKKNQRNFFAREVGR